MTKKFGRTRMKPVSTTVGVSPAVRVFDSMKVIFPGMSISNKCICRHKYKENQEQDVLRTDNINMLAQDHISLY